MRVLGGRIVLVEGQSRKRPTGYVQEHARSGPSSSSGASSHHHDDRPRPPARLHSPLEVALRDGPTRATVSAAVPRVVLDFTWAVNHQRVGAEGQARSVRERRWSIWQCGWFGVRTWSTGFEPQEWTDQSSPFGFLTMIYMFCALVGWWGTIWRASTDRSPAQRRCRESTPRRRSPRPRSASAERSHALPPAPRSFAPEKASLRAQHFSCRISHFG